MTSGHDEDPREPEPAAREASHVDAKFATTRRLCRQTLIQSPGLHYLGHYTEGAFDFSYNRPDGTSGQLDWMDYERIGVQISNAFRGFDRLLHEAKTGALIRIVVHGRQGLMICNSARPTEHVVGFSHARTALPAEGAVLSRLSGASDVDEAISKLATALRRQVNLGPQNPGFWLSEKPDDVAFPLVNAPAIAPYLEGTSDSRITGLLADQIDPAGLQLVAYCRRGRLEFSADQLHHPELGPYFQEISVTERRLFYQHMCRYFPIIVRKLGRITTSATGSKVERLVLDVEQGALYYYRIRPAEYLVGVTMDQRQISSTDDKIGEIAVNFRNDLPVTPTDR